MNWEIAKEMMEAVERNIVDSRHKLRYIMENLEDLNGKRDSLRYAEKIQDEFVDYVKFEISKLNNLLNTINEKADKIG